MHATQGKKAISPNQRTMKQLSRAFSSEMRMLDEKALDETSPTNEVNKRACITATKMVP